MKTHTLYFNDAAVKAIRKGSKTQARIPLREDTVVLPSPESKMCIYGHRPPDVYWFEGLELHLMRVRPVISEGDRILIYTRDYSDQGDNKTTVIVKGVWLQKLRSISNEDVLKEGLTVVHHEDRPETDVRLSYKLHWDRLYEDEFPWQDDPWVWVIEFQFEGTV